MVMTMKKQPSHSQWWWLDSHHSTTKRSPWLQSTLSELDDKTEAMLKLIEGDADSFAQRAEMYYKKRPELMSMVEDFYRAHRLLAERYDQLKSEAGTRLLTTVGSPFSCNKYRHEKSMSAMDQNYDSYSESFEHEENTESEVEDPEEEEEVTGRRRQETESMGHRIEHKPCQKNETAVSHEKDDAWAHQEAKEESGSSWFSEDEVKKLKEEIERLKEENSMQKEKLMQKDEEKREVIRLREENSVQKEKLVQKDEEKREVIRQLSLTSAVLKDENVRLKKHIVAREAKKFNLFEFDKLMGGFLGKLFNGSSKHPPTVVAL